MVDQIDLDWPWSLPFVLLLLLSCSLSQLASLCHSESLWENSGLGSIRDGAPIAPTDEGANLAVEPPVEVRLWLFLDVSEEFIGRLWGMGIPFVKSFTYKQINKATSGFGVILESGLQGTIYKAQFPNGLVGAVRRVRSHQLQNNSFLKNVQLLGRLHHRHLVKLKGFCEGKDRFLVFDYMENGRLKDYLHDPLKTPLNWRTRLQIAIDIAAALEYLQYFCEPPIYNVSISSNNIFLDENFVAKLSDVGFVDCDLICNGESNITSSEDNTEQRNRRLVFQFGMLLLELITGQSLLNEAEIVHWIQESGFAYSIHKMVDTDLGDSYDSKELGSLLVVARLCTKAENDTSISIPQILRFLQGHIGHSTL